MRRNTGETCQYEEAAVAYVPQTAPPWTPDETDVSYFILAHLANTIPLTRGLQL